MKLHTLKNINKILILQYKPFGDVLLNTAYLPFLKDKFPDSKIDYLIRSPYDIVLEGNPNINKLIVFKNLKGISYLLQRIRIIGTIRKEKYDLVIDQLKGSGSAGITLFSNARYRLGYSGHKWGFVYNIKALKGPLRYFAAMKFDLLKPIGITEESYKTFFYIKNESTEYINRWAVENNLENSRIICVAPGSPVNNKKWSYKYFAKLCDMLLDNTKYKIVMMGTPYERNDINKIIDNMNNKPLISPETTFNQAAALLKKSELLICNDGGLNHLSIAVDTASLAIFGNTNPKKWSGHELGNHFFLKNYDFQYGKDNTFGIVPGEVYDKALEILLKKN